jgi:drug/metabolite transporter (DMT)-like permease
MEVGYKAATATGILAVFMWALLGVFTAGSGHVPPFLLNALCFGISGGVSMLWLVVTGRAGRLRQPLSVWIVGTGGLFGFHALYFTALRNAPALEANLINYLWPLLIVLMSGLLPGEQLKPHHIVGVAVGFAGAALLIASRGVLSLDGGYALGYGAAIASALTWSSYSVISRRMAKVPTEAVSGFCLATAVLSLVAHGLFETTVLPQGGTEWTMVLLLGIFPVGLAFFVWDYGVKKGDIQVLGAAAYAAPVLSTLLLAATGYGTLSLVSALAAVMVTAGALIAAKDMLLKKRPSSV